MQGKRKRERIGERASERGQERRRQGVREIQRECEREYKRIHARKNESVCLCVCGHARACAHMSVCCRVLWFCACLYVGVCALVYSVQVLHLCAQEGGDPKYHTMWSSRVARMDWSCHTYKRVMSRVWRRYITHWEYGSTAKWYRFNEGSCCAHLNKGIKLALKRVCQWAYAMMQTSIR